MKQLSVGVRIALRWAAVLVFVGAGFNHFRVPRLYESIMPPFLPQPRILIDLSGIFEIIGGIGLAFGQTRRIAAWGLIALLIAVFPANVWMAVGPRNTAGHGLPLWVLLARLPLQGMLIAWVGWIGGLLSGGDRQSRQLAPGR